MAVNTQSLGQRIKRCRERKGLTGTQLAAGIGVTDDAVRKYERDERDVPFSRLQRIAAVLDIRLSTLVKGLDLAPEEAAA